MASRSSNQGWTKQLSDAVREAAPEVPAFAEAEQAALWREIETGVTVTPQRHRWKAVAAGFAAVVVVGGAGAAAASVMSAHTGKGPVDTEDTRLGGPGERLNPTAPDFASVLDQVTFDIRFPSAGSRARALSWEVEDLSDHKDTLVSTGALRLWMAGHALCSWTNTWAVALSDGDGGTEQQAADVILGARNWPAITDTDPHLANESEFAWLPDLERAVESGDPSAARRALAPNQSCMPGLAPGWDWASGGEVTRLGCAGGGAVPTSRRGTSRLPLPPRWTGRHRPPWGGVRRGAAPAGRPARARDAEGVALWCRTPAIAGGRAGQLASGARGA